MSLHKQSVAELSQTQNFNKLGANRRESEVRQPAANINLPTNDAVCSEVHVRGMFVYWNSQHSQQFRGKFVMKVRPGGLLALYTWQVD